MNVGSLFSGIGGSWRTMMAEKIGKWLKAVEVPVAPGRKTKEWDIMSYDGSRIAVVKWYGPFRKYSLLLESGAAWEDQCLDAISSFLKRVNAERKAERET